MHQILETVISNDILNRLSVTVLATTSSFIIMIIIGLFYKLLGSTIYKYYMFKNNNINSIKEEPNKYKVRNFEESLSINYEFPKTALKIIKKHGVEACFIKPLFFELILLKTGYFYNSDEEQDKKYYKKYEKVVFDILNNYPENCFQGYLHDDKGNNLLMIACKLGLSDIASNIIDTFGKNINMSQINNKGNNALMISIDKSLSDISLKIIRGLRKNSIVVKQINKYGSTVLLRSCCKKLKKVAITILTKFGTRCLIGQSNIYGSTALTHACDNNMVSVMRYMIANFKDECDVLHKNNYGLSAIDIVKKNRNNLKKSINKNNRSPVETTKLKEMKDVIGLLDN